MSTARKILIVEDDEELRASLIDQLALHEEFEALAVGNAAGGLDTARSEHWSSPGLMDTF